MSNIEELEKYNNAHGGKWVKVKSDALEFGNWIFELSGEELHPVGQLVDAQTTDLFIHLNNVTIPEISSILIELKGVIEERSILLNGMKTVSEWLHHRSVCSECNYASASDEYCEDGLRLYELFKPYRERAYILIKKDRENS